MGLILAVDFDSTLFVHQREPVPFAAESMQRLKRDGHTLIVWSVRANRKEPEPIRSFRVQEMEELLRTYDIPFDRIDYGNEGKVYADLYIDDHALGIPLVRFDGALVVDWITAYDMIRLEWARKRLVR